MPDEGLTYSHIEPNRHPLVRKIFLTFASTFLIDFEYEQQIVNIYGSTNITSNWMKYEKNRQKSRKKDIGSGLDSVSLLRWVFWCGLWRRISLKVFRGGIVSGGIAGGSFPGSLKRIGKTRLF